MPGEARTDWAGVDYSALVLDPAAESVQDYVVFTFDDFQAGQPNGPYVSPPNHIRSIREERYKLARYFDPDGNEAEQWEMYDLQEDPLETVNIANPDFSRTAEQEQELQRLTRQIDRCRGDAVAAVAEHPRGECHRVGFSSGRYTGRSRDPGLGVSVSPDRAA